jgi:ABC-type transporter MlaC component
VSHDPTFALAYISSLKETVCRKYAKDLWAINFHHFTTTELCGQTLTPEQQANFTMVRTHLVQKYQSDMARYAEWETEVVSSAVHNDWFAQGAVAMGFSMPVDLTPKRE